MSKVHLFPLLLSSALLMCAHPMGNFSVNHYARIDLSQHASTLTYVLDLAEIPTFELLQQWNVDAKNTNAVRLRARGEAKNWLQNLVIDDNQRSIFPVLKTVQVNLQDGAGGMPILRIVMVSTLPLRSGKVGYEDRNYPGRTGWKEIVIRRGTGVEIVNASQGDNDVSGELTRYPIDPSIVPPQQLKASLELNVQPQLVARSPHESIWSKESSKKKDETIVPAIASAPKPFAVQQPTAPGTVVKGDFLSRLLQTRELGFGLILIGIAVAFGLGAMHALSPGHGKTIVAAYLVGSRGTIRHALFLGSTVTLTHTMSVFLLGIGVLCFERYIVPDRIIPWLGALSGLSIVSIGVVLLYQRTRALLPAMGQHGHHEHGHEHQHAHSHTHGHDSGHAHTHEHGPSHTHVHEPNHEHSHGSHVHTHGGRPHSHMPAGKITLGSLIALGVSGGLVPCPSALVLMLSAIALGHAGLGLMLLVGFSCGLALVLMGIGILVIYAKQLIPYRLGLSSHPFFRLVPVFSAVIVVCLGLGMTAVSLGWVQPSRFGI